MPGDVLDSFLGPDECVDSHVRILPDSILPSALTGFSLGWQTCVSIQGVTSSRGSDLFSSRGSHHPGGQTYFQVIPGGQTYFQVIPDGPDSSNSSSRPLNRSRTLASVANQAAKRRVKLGTLSARDTPSTAASSALVAAVRLRAR